MIKFFCICLCLFLMPNLFALEEPIYLISDVGVLQKNTQNPLNNAKYVLLNGDIVLKYINEPSDVDMSVMIGRMISITGYKISVDKFTNITTITMKSASTFG